MRRHRPWLLWLALALLLMLGALAMLQYQWLGEVSQAGRNRLMTTLRGHAEQFTEEFDREVARAFFWLQVDPATLDGNDWTRFAERYERWLAGASYPRLVRAIWLYAPGRAPRRFDPASRSFVVEAVPAALVPLSTEIGQEFATSEGARPGNATWIHGIREDVPAIVAPLPQFVAFTSDSNVRVERINPLAHRGYTVIVLDEKYIKSELLPHLASRAFGPAATSDYHVTVRSRTGGREVFSYGPPLQSAAGAPDIELDLFDVRLETIADLRSAALGAGKADGLPGPQSASDQTETGKVTPAPERRRFTLSVIQRQVPGEPRNPVAIPGPLWRLDVRHRAGSLEAAVATARHRNLALSGGILLLFASSIGLLVVSVQRASRLAAQQVEFVAAVSHELRTPLAVIRSAGENLADGVVLDSAQVKRYGELVRNEGLRLSSLVEQVLAFAGMRGDHQVRRLSVRVSDVVRRGVEGASADLQESGLSVETDVAPELPDVGLDAEAIARALTNLLSNAAKYAREGGQVRVTAALGVIRKGRELRIAVADRGPGIAPEDLPHIFEPFYRAPSVIASRIHGTGLGLSLVQAIARAHGGRVTVECGDGGGSTFTLYLPIVSADAHAPAGHPVTASRS